MHVHMFAILDRVQPREPRERVFVRGHFVWVSSFAQNVLPTWDTHASYSKIVLVCMRTALYHPHQTYSLIQYISDSQTVQKRVMTASGQPLFVVQSE
jgi:hypothetical protein